MKTNELCNQPIKLYLLIILIFSALDFFSQSKDHIDFNSPANILKFANYLFCEKDYLRAIDEYNKYLSYNNSDTVIFKSALCFSRIGNSSEAKKLFYKLLLHNKFSDEAILEIAKIEFNEKNFSKLNEVIRDTIYQKNRYFPSIQILKQISILYNDTLSENLNPQSFSIPFPESSREDIRNFYNRKLNTKYKSPIFSAILSAIIPGAGKIYTGYYGDGISAFLLTGVLGYVSYADFNAHHNFRGWLFAGLTGIFYLGNIYGSAVSAQIRNSQLDFNFKFDLDTFLTKNNYFLPDDEYCK